MTDQEISGSVASPDSPHNGNPTAANIVRNGFFISTHTDGPAAASASWRVFESKSRPIM